MFRNVPECSEMFHVPGFIDGPKDFRFSHATIINIRTQAKVGDKSCVLENFPENLCLQNFVAAATSRKKSNQT